MLKKQIKKVSLVVTVFCIMAGFVLSNITPLVVKAASEVTIHVKDNSEWGSVNIYNWGDAGEIVGAWPGTPMEADNQAEGWYTYTFSTDYALKLVFCVDSNGDGTAEAQTGNVEDLSADGKEYWIIIGGTEELPNDYGVKGDGTTLYTEPQNGFPTLDGIYEGDASTTETEEGTSEEATDSASTEESNTAEDSTADTTEVTSDAVNSNETKDSSKTENSTLRIVAPVIVAVVIILGILILIQQRKKKNKNK